MTSAKPSKAKKKSPGLPSWITLPNVIFFIVIAIFSILFFWSETFSVFFSEIKLADIQIKPTPTILPGTPTALPYEWYSSTQQTSGIILGGIVVMSIILFGCAGIMFRDRRKQ